MLISNKAQEKFPTPQKQVLCIFCVSALSMFLLGVFIFNLSWPCILFSISSFVLYLKIKNKNNKKYNLILAIMSAFWLFLCFDFYHNHLPLVSSLFITFLIFILLQIYLYNKFLLGDLMLFGVALVSGVYIVSLFRDLIGIVIVMGGLFIGAIIIFKKYEPVFYSEKDPYESFKNKMLLPLVFLQCLGGVRWLLEIAKYEMQYAKARNLTFYPMLSMLSAFLWVLIVHYVSNLCFKSKNITKIFILNRKKEHFKI